MFATRLRRQMEREGQIKIVTTKRTWWRMVPAALASLIAFAGLLWFIVQVPSIRNDLRLAGAILLLPVIFLLVEVVRHISVVYAMGHSMIRTRGGVINPWRRRTLFSQVQDLDDDPMAILGPLLRFTELRIFLGHERPIEMLRCPMWFANELAIRHESGGIGPPEPSEPPETPPSPPPTPRTPPRRRGLSGGNRRGYG